MFQSPPTSRPSANKSIANLTKDEDFVEFLKKIELYVTDENSPRNNNLLFNNLKFIREKYKVYKSTSPAAFRKENKN